jgi:predicted nucleic acid-binding protein
MHAGYNRDQLQRALPRAYESKNVRTNLASVKGFLSTIAVQEFNEQSAEKADQFMAQLEVKGPTVDASDLFIGCIF